MDLEILRGTLEALGAPMQSIRLGDHFSENFNLHPTGDGRWTTYYEERGWPAGEPLTAATEAGGCFLMLGDFAFNVLVGGVLAPQAPDYPGAGARHPAVLELLGPQEPQALPETGAAWPDARHHPEGFAAPEDRIPVRLAAGTVVDRFGAPFGRALTEAATPFAARALPLDALGLGYHRYEVLREIPVWQGRLAAAFGGPGGGVQYATTLPVHHLLSGGYLREMDLGAPSLPVVEPLRSPRSAEWTADSGPDFELLPLDLAAVHLGYPPHIASDGGVREQAWCAVPKEGGGEPVWRVFWRERGQEIEPEEVGSRAAARRYIVGRLAYARLLAGDRPAAMPGRAASG